MSDPTAAPAKDTGVAGKYVQYGDHIDTLDSVDVVFKAQRKLSFTYGADLLRRHAGNPSPDRLGRELVCHPDLGRLHRELPRRLAALLRLPLGHGLDLLQAGRQDGRAAHGDRR